MDRNTMFILSAIISLALGFGAQYLIRFIARKVENRVTACTYGCLIGIVLMMLIVVTAYIVVPSIARVTGGSVNVGVMI